MVASFGGVQALRKTLDAGNDLGMPDGVLINGKGPYRYNDTLVPEGIDFETINVQPGEYWHGCSANLFSIIEVPSKFECTCLNIVNFQSFFVELHV